MGIVSKGFSQCHRSTGTMQTKLKIPPWNEYLTSSSLRFLKISSSTSPRSENWERPYRYSHNHHHFLVIMHETHQMTNCESEVVNNLPCRRAKSYILFNRSFNESASHTISRGSVIRVWQQYNDMGFDNNSESHDRNSSGILQSEKLSTRKILFLVRILYW